MSPEGIAPRGALHPHRPDRACRSDLDLVIDPSLDPLNELVETLDPERFYVDPDVARI